LIRYLSGLNEEIAHVVELYSYTSLDELSVLAHKVELQKRIKGKGMVSKPNPRPYPLQNPSYKPPKPAPNTNPRSPPPTALQTPSKQPLKPVDKKRCFCCQDLGYYASECPNKKMVSLVEYQASCEELEEENDEGEKELLMIKALEGLEVGPDEGEMLVIRRAFSGLASQNDLEQRENIFHTRCTMKGKVCSLIIDGGSYANVASKTLVEKLKLSVSPHPSPYTI